MIVEVHSSARPGRPVLLIVVVFVALCGSLALAWTQTVAKRSLGPAQNIEGTPLIVRAPRGWSESAGRPGFYYLADKTHADTEDGAMERQISFRYLRLPQYVSPEEYIVASDSRQRASSANPESTQIRGIRAVQVRRVRVVTVRGYKFEKESVLRVACHPRGDVISVEYAPMTELTRADFQLLDAVCDAVDFNDTDLKVSGEEAQKRIGLAFPTKSDWSLVGTRQSASSALYILSGPAGEAPANVRVARSWRSESRTELDLLRDAILSDKRMRSEKMRLLEWVRRDGVQVTGAQVWKPGSRASDDFLAYAISASAADIALVLPDFATITYRSLQTAKTVAETLTFTQWAGRADLEAARRAGERLISEINEHGAMAWWGRDPQKTNYHDRAGDVEAGCATQRRAGDGDPQRGYPYSGGYAWADLAAKRYVRQRWTLDRKALGFERTLEFGGCVYGLGLQFLKPDRMLWEKREGGKKTVWRRERREGLETESEYAVSTTFAAPPLETLVAARVAHGNDPAVLIDVSNRDGTNTHSRLLIPMGLDDRKIAFVLCLEDYAPTGVTVGFDEENQPVQFVEFGLPLDRLAKSDREPLITRLRTKLDE